MYLVAAEIESLKNRSLEELEKFLERMSKDERLAGPMDSYPMVLIEVDGDIYEIPEPVNNLLNSIYRMYKKAAKESNKNKLL
jgi:hypothetical protein|tara:strand:- start:1730 stop:1975 length:246 start_codon:yes stop_codon:yes gene_type:complete